MGDPMDGMYFFIQDTTVINSLILYFLQYITGTEYSTSLFNVTCATVFTACIAEIY